MIRLAAEKARKLRFVCLLRLPLPFATAPLRLECEAA
jgi:hypothetical protein